jgi:hypothetical protein
VLPVASLIRLRKRNPAEFKLQVARATAHNHLVAKTFAAIQPLAQNGLYFGYSISLRDATDLSKIKDDEAGRSLRRDVAPAAARRLDLCFDVHRDVTIEDVVAVKNAIIEHGLPFNSTSVTIEVVDLKYQ